MIIHKDCGGKLVVKDTAQETTDSGIQIQRMRKCDKCGILVYSFENVMGAMSCEGYKHKR